MCAPEIFKWTGKAKFYMVDFKTSFIGRDGCLTILLLMMLCYSAGCGNQNSRSAEQEALDPINVATQSAEGHAETASNSDQGDQGEEGEDISTTHSASAPVVNRQLDDEATEAQTGKLYLKSVGTESMVPSAGWPEREIALGINNQHADKGGNLNSTNVGQLVEAWHLVGAELVSHTPLIHAERLYFADWGGVVYATDLRDGTILWKKDVAIPHRPWPWHGFAGTGAFGEGLLFEASVEGDAFAINPENGEVVWQTRFVEQEDAGNLSDLLYHDGLIYIGVQSVAEGLDAGYDDYVPTFRGNVVALKAQSGEVAWRTYLVDPPQNGAAVWSSFAVDPDLNALYFTTSNNYTGEASLTSDAVISLDATTGDIRWINQTTAGDVWTPAEPFGSDYGYGAGAQLFEATIDGKNRKLVASGQKSGFYHAFDRDTGEPIWSAFVGFGQVGGGIRGEASISGDRIYIWSNNGYIGTNSPQEYPMSVRALDAATGHNLWLYDRAQPAGGAAAGFLINDVYFVGSLDGTLQAYNASTGEMLYRILLPGTIASSISVYADMIYVGIGVPSVFGGDPDARGVIALKLP